MTIETLKLILHLLIPLGILNVWLIRRDKATVFRGGTAKTLKSEFAEYGLPDYAFYVVGAAKFISAALVFLGIFFPSLTFPGALAMAVLMVGALLMHAKVKDPLTRYLPAFAMLTLCLVLLF
jgi:hypothetical protein